MNNKKIEQAFKDAERLAKYGIKLTEAEKNYLKYLATLR
jgi:hypothetical protein